MPQTACESCEMLRKDLAAALERLVDANRRMIELLKENQALKYGACTPRLECGDDFPHRGER